MEEKVVSASFESMVIRDQKTTVVFLLLGFEASTKLCDRNSAELPPNAKLTTVQDILYADFGLSQNPGVTTTASPVYIAPGNRVKRGPTWAWGDQDGGAGYLGTVNFYSSSPYWWQVTWDLGQVNVYRMGDVYQDLIIVG